ncbi:MAG: hypothetical protein ACRCZE_01825 [Candidatus Altimarinota bacterium]
METNNQDQKLPDNSIGKLPEGKPENAISANTGEQGLPKPAVAKLDLGSGNINDNKPENSANKPMGSGMVNLKSTPAMLALNISKDELDSFSKGKKAEEAAKYSVSGTPSIVDKIADKKSEVEDVDFFKNAALDEKAGGSKLLENVSAQKINLSKPDMNKLLGSSKILEKTLEQEGLEKAKKRLNLLRIGFALLMIVALGVNGFFFYQLNPSLSLAGLYEWKFEGNLRSQIITTNQSLNSVQTLYNKYRYLTGNLYLTQFGFEATRLFDNVKALENPITVNQREPLEAEIADSKTVLIEMMAGAKENLVPSIVVKNYPVRGEDAVDESLLAAKAQVDLKQTISEEKQNQQLDNAELASDAMKRELIFIESTQELVGNDALISNLSRKDTGTLEREMNAYITGEDPGASASFENFVGNLLAATKVDLAVISDLRENRVVWSEVLNRIDEITSGVDRDHNAGNNNNSRTSYSSYSFDAFGHKVSLSGLNLTDSGTNRAVTTVLIEKFEASPEFKQASNRSFPVSRTENENGSMSYQMNFRLELVLEDGKFSLSNGPVVDLAEVTESSTPVRRNPNANAESNSSTSDSTAALTPASENAEAATGIANTLINTTNNPQ